MYISSGPTTATSSLSHSPNQTTLNLKRVDVSSPCRTKSLGRQEIIILRKCRLAKIPSLMSSWTFMRREPHALNLWVAVDDDRDYKIKNIT